MDQSQNNALITRIMALKAAPLEEMKTKYKEVFNEANPNSNNRAHLWRKIAYRLQEIECGGLSSETQGRIGELIERYDPINNKLLQPQNAPGKKSQRTRHTPTHPGGHHKEGIQRPDPRGQGT